MAKRKKTNCTYIGGQAVMEGVMMLGKTGMATAVRDSSGDIQIEAKRIKRSKSLTRALKVPFLRGMINLVESLIRGTKTLMRSAAVFGDEDEEPHGLQKWFAEKLKLNLIDVITIISSIVGVLLAMGIFIFLPRYLTGLILPDTHWGHYLILGGFRLVIFIGYLSLILVLKDIRRLYKYHGAEHKTINAYEHGLDLTVENVKSCSRLHDRCGTSFLFIVLFINIVVISVASWALSKYGLEWLFTQITVSAKWQKVLRYLCNVGAELILLPIIAGVSYEVLKIFAKLRGPFFEIFKFPGKLLQKLLTTREPDDEMIEVAIAAFNKVLEMDADETVPETDFVTSGVLSKLMAATKARFKEKGIDESDAEWIYSIVLDVPRDMLKVERAVSPAESKRIREIEDERLTGRPLWYIIGDTEFYGCTIKVDERVLIPRPETELLADYVFKSCEQGYKVLDLCTGSGCIAISVAKKCAGMGVSVTASDISADALLLARENAKLNDVSVNFVLSDMFTSVRGRFNVIVCNPPYVKRGDLPFLQKEVKDFEPQTALDGGDDGLDFYRRIAKSVKSYLAKDGILLLEYGEGQTEEILKIFEKRDYAMVMKDLSGTDRFIKIAF